MKKIMPVLLAFVLVTTLAACGNNIEQGEVIDRTFTPAHSQVRIIPVYISNGKSGRYIYVPYVYHYPDKWEIKIQQYDKSKEKMLYATYRVTEDVYDAADTGTEFVYSKEYEPTEPEYTREKTEDNTQ